MHSPRYTGAIETFVGIFEYVMFTYCDVPFTVTVPDAGYGLYDATFPAVNAYVPLGTMNVTELDVVLNAVPLRVAYHAVPAGRPVSLNVV